MMTTTDRLTAMIDIERSILRDIADRPPFTMTRAQLLTRISNYTLDNPTNDANDCNMIFAAMITDPDLPIRDR